MFNLISNLNAKTSTLDIIADLRENINYIKKIGLFLNIAQNINFWLIINDVHIIDNLTIVSNIKFNSYVIYYLESYQSSQNFVVNYMLKIFVKSFMDRNIQSSASWIDI